MNTTILRRAANAFFEDVDADVPRQIGPLAHIVEAAINSFRRRNRGLWVGGTVAITATDVEFQPNSLNVAAHKNAYSFVIPYKSILDVQVAKGFGTNIVVLATARGERRFRCFKAAEAAKMIRDMRQQSKR